MPESPAPRRLAVLIDADNASPAIAPDLFKEIAKIGDASVRRIYGDFSGTSNAGWTKILHEHAIIPQMNVANTRGKNASDIAMVIDAMDLMHSGRLDGFCIVSSDGDFTRLAARLREEGLAVFGLGERKTPESFRNACQRFIYTENLGVDVDDDEPETAAKPKKGEPPSKAVPLIRSALNLIESEDGWYHLGGIGSTLMQIAPDFDTRTYGCAKLSTLIEKSGAFEMKKVNTHFHVRRR